MSAATRERPWYGWPFMSATLERGTVDTSNPAVCIGCGCTDSKACADGCSWLGVNRRTGRGVCSNCADHLEAWKAEAT